MTQPIWITESLLGSFVAGSAIKTNLIAIPVLPANAISYTLTNGLLPPGLGLTTTGFIEGTFTSTTSGSYIFTVTATDNLGESSNRIFSMNVTVKPIQPTWVTTAGSIGSFPALIPLSVTLQANAATPATITSYKLLSGTLPAGISLSTNGIIFGTPEIISQETIYLFTVRVTDSNNTIADRTFSITVSGSAIPEFTVPDGNILQILDSIWIELPITYTNPIPTNQIEIRVLEGILPPGLEINQNGMIRGYAQAPIVNVNLPTVTTVATNTNSVNNAVTCLTTINFTVGRPIVFTGSPMFGGIVAGTTYFIQSIISPTEFTLSTTQNGTPLLLNNGTGLITATLPSISVGQPTIRTFSFSLKLESPLGSDIGNYSITVINQNTPISQNGPGYPAGTRLPVILNTRPRTFSISPNDPYYGYYVLPENSSITYPINFASPIGNYESDNFFAFKIIGNDFDGDTISYDFANLPSWMTGNSSTGWLTGTPSFITQNISKFNFDVAVYKTSNPVIRSPYFSFSVIVEKDITNTVVWITPSDLGIINNGTVSTKSVIAEADSELLYRLAIGSTLPANLTLLPNGEITGFVMYQPTDVLLSQGDSTTFSFTIEAYSEQFLLINSSKTFSLTVYQQFEQPTDILYIKAAPSVEDRVYIESLLNNSLIFPTEYLYRPNDPYFGKATNVIYEHAYGIYSSDIQQYINAVTQNHYWRNLILGELNTARAVDGDGNVIYEVVYSSIIDNLVNQEGISISNPIYWPRSIDLNLGPYYTSVTNIYTSFINVNNQDYYTSLTPGYANVLYPNSLHNMRNRVGDVLGQEFNSELLPLWMTSQQENGSTLGYTQAWVICYTKPGFAKIIKDKIDTLWVDVIGRPNKLNKINFQIDRFIVNKSLTFNYDNTTDPANWTGLPSATPTPNPIDSKDFYVLFPRKTILPDETQY